MSKGQFRSLMMGTIYVYIPLLDTHVRIYKSEAYENYLAMSDNDDMTVLHKGGNTYIVFN